MELVKIIKIKLKKEQLKSMYVKQLKKIKRKINWKIMRMIKIKYNKKIIKINLILFIHISAEKHVSRKSIKI